MFLDPGGISTSGHYDVSILSSVSSTPRTSTMRSFRGSIARPSYLLCTLHAAITDDYATLAYRLVAILCRVVISGDRVHSVNFNVFQHLLQLRTFHGAMMSDPDAPMPHSTALHLLALLSCSRRNRQFTLPDDRSSAYR